MKPKSNKGRLFLVPVGLGGNAMEMFLPAGVVKQVHGIQEFIVEHPKSARHFLKSIGYPHDFDRVIFWELNKHEPEEGIGAMLAGCEGGNDVGLLSEAGAPAVADPGALVVALAHKKCIQVVPLVGPSSILLALMASGLNGQSFAFHGYLPFKDPELTSTLRRMEVESKKENRAQIFIEAPYRNQKLFEALTKTLHPETLLCIAVEVTTENESIFTKSISEWKKKAPGLHKRPAVFLIQGR